MKINLNKKIVLLVLSISVLALSLTVFLLVNQANKHITDLSLAAGKSLPSALCY